MQKTVKCRLCAVFLLVATLLGVFLCLPLQVSASSIRDSSDVLADLKQDPNFHTDEYPVVNGDAAINFIHLAESEQGEVLIYVYQPHQTPVKYRASSINISATADGSLNIKNYYLDLLDYDGVFQKYLVRDFAALTKNERVYEVVSIFRMFDATVDQGLGDDNDNTIQEVVYPVGKRFQFTDTPNGMTTNVSDLQYIQVTDKYVGFMRYPAGSLGFTDVALDVHYVAFSTNFAMEKLLEADVYYTKQYFEKTGSAGKLTFGEKTPDYSYLNVKEQLVYDRDAWWSKEYSWNSIEKPEAFLASSEGKTLYKKGVFDTYTISTVDEEARKHITDSEWVLRFAQTEYMQKDLGAQVPYTNYYGYIVGEVSILRLAFETDGQYYNLPVIDNKQSGSLTPSNKIEYEVQASEWWQKIMMLLCLILLAVVLAIFWNPISAVLKILWKGVSVLLKALLWLLLLPFKLLGRIFRRRK
jgi:hypothetical protein